MAFDPLSPTDTAILMVSPAVADAQFHESNATNATPAILTYMAHPSCDELRTRLSIKGKLGAAPPAHAALLSTTPPPALSASHPVAQNFAAERPDPPYRQPRCRAHRQNRPAFWLQAPAAAA